MFDWYTTMNQPDWDGRTYAFPQPMGAAPVQPMPQQNPMQRPQGSVSGGLLGKLAEEGEQATPRMPSPFGPRQGQGGAAASPAPSPAPVQRPAPQPVDGARFRAFGRARDATADDAAAVYAYGRALRLGTAFAANGRTGYSIRTNGQGR